MFVRRKDEVGNWEGLNRYENEKRKVSHLRLSRNARKYASLKKKALRTKLVDYGWSDMTSRNHQKYGWRAHELSPEILPKITAVNCDYLSYGSIHGRK